MTIAVTTPIAIASGDELTIFGTYDAVNVGEDNITLTDAAKSIFTNFSASEGTFSAILPSTTQPGTYILQLVANNVISNKISFIACYNDTGTNWPNRTGGSVDMTFDDTNKTATIIARGSQGVGNNYAATNLVIPNEVIHNSEIYQVIKIDDFSFNNTSLTGNLTIPDSVTSIGDYAFYARSGLNGSLTIGRNVTSIGEGAFKGCSGLGYSLIIPDSVTSIGAGAFGYCSGFIGSLNIGRNVTSIGSAAFKNCTLLAGRLLIHNKVLSIGNSAFDGCNLFTNITLDGYDIPHDWTGIEIFQNWNESSSNCTVSTSGGTLIAGEACTYLKGIGLPSNWNPES